MRPGHMCQNNCWVSGRGDVRVGRFRTVPHPIKGCKIRNPTYKNGAFEAERTLRDAT